MRMVLALLATLLGGCAHSPYMCPDLPYIQDGEDLRTYSVKIIKLYNACKDHDVKAKEADSGGEASN